MKFVVALIENQVFPSGSGAIIQIDSVLRNRGILDMFWNLWASDSQCTRGISVNENVEKSSKQAGKNLKIHQQQTSILSQAHHSKVSNTNDEQRL